ncbi:hypothetical protein B0H19DRAFT_1063250 [Mycena capillaripes]|nr:hypothetical protein B0H19DRAFT_1063250 [Mycena capillaripes]
MVTDYLEQIDAAKQNHVKVTFDRTVKPLRNNSVGWIWDGWQQINDADLVKQSFKSCRAKKWDLSYECLTGFEARETLRRLKDTDPEFWDELQSGKIRALEKHNERYADNPDPASTAPADEDELIDATEVPSHREPLTSENNDAESLDDIEPMETWAKNVMEGKRRRKPTTRYQGIWQHRDDVHSVNEEYS